MDLPAEGRLDVHVNQGITKRFYFVENPLSVKEVFTFSNMLIKF